MRRRPRRSEARGRQPRIARSSTRPRRPTPWRRSPRRKPKPRARIARRKARRTKPTRCSCICGLAATARAVMLPRRSRGCSMSWVARVVDFEPLRQDYWMLSELPSRFDEHAKQMRAAAEADVTAVARARDGRRPRAPACPSVRATQARSTRKRWPPSITSIAAKEAEIKRAHREARRVLVGPGRAIPQGHAAPLRHVPQGADAHAARAREPHAESRGRRGRRRAHRDPRRSAARRGRGRALQKLHEQHRDRSAKLEEVRNSFKEQRFDAVTSEFMNSTLIATMMNAAARAARSPCRICGTR